jgi:hypothetical protein
VCSGAQASAAIAKAQEQRALLDKLEAVRAHAGAHRAGRCRCRRSADHARGAQAVAARGVEGLRVAVDAASKAGLSQAEQVVSAQRLLSKARVALPGNATTRR